MIKTPIMFIKNPTLAISAILILPLPKTIALGGVATGIINAQDAERWMLHTGMVIVVTNTYTSKK